MKEKKCSLLRFDDFFFAFSPRPAEMSQRPIHSEGRQRMRPWLEYHINNGQTPGLAWIDKEEKVFKVPWKHVGNREWSESDGTIFKVSELILFCSN